MTVVWNPLRFTIVCLLFGYYLQGLHLLKNSHQLRLSGLNGSVDISTFDIESGLIVGIVVEKLGPVLFVELLSENVMHFFAIGSQFSKRVFSVCIICWAIVFFEVDWVARSMPKQLIDHDQLGLFAVYWQNKQENES